MKLEIPTVTAHDLVSLVEVQLTLQDRFSILIRWKDSKHFHDTWCFKYKVIHDFASEFLVQKWNLNSISQKSRYSFKIWLNAVSKKWGQSKRTLILHRIEFCLVLRILGVYSPNDRSQQLENFVFGFLWATICDLLFYWSFPIVYICYPCPNTTNSKKVCGIFWADYQFFLGTY